MKHEIKYWLIGFTLLTIIGLAFVRGFNYNKTTLVEGPSDETPEEQPETTNPNSTPNQSHQEYPPQTPNPPQLPSITVTAINSNYEPVQAKPTGWFTPGQEADLMLSGFGFNNAGGPLLFNHPGGIATDGTHLILADRNNNRVLIWNKIPKENTAPDIVLGQPDFTSNNPGSELDELNWPVGVATDGKHLIVADTYNHRVLIWNSFPTRNQQPADIVLQGDDIPNNPRTIGWPWAVWTNGEKLIVTKTLGSSVLIWNTFPTTNNQEPDIVLHLKDFGTPRTIGSDGTNLIIGDHNAFKQERGNFFWKSFPTEDNQKYDFFMKNPFGDDLSIGEILWGPTFTNDGKLIAVGEKLYIWNSFPEDENDPPDLEIGTRGDAGSGYDFGGKQSGDGSGIAYHNGSIYISLSNGNKIVGFKQLPTSPEQKPDFVIGAPELYTNTLETEFIISNPVPVTDGKSLFVSSDFDGKLYVWKSLPNEDGAKPDYVYSNLDGPWDNTLHKGVLVLAGKQTVYIWKAPPLNGEEPDVVHSRNLGSIEFYELKGVAMDDKYFYLADEKANKVYVWNGVPYEDTEPVFSIDVEGPTRLSSDGEHLVVTATTTGAGGSIFIYDISKLPYSQPTVLTGMFNLPQGALIYNKHLFVCDTGNNAVHIWNTVEDAKMGKPADIILGKKGFRPEIGRDTLFWPAALTFDGSYLWVAEFKFSERLLRFSVK